MRYVKESLLLILSHASVQALETMLLPIGLPCHAMDKREPKSLPGGVISIEEFGADATGEKDSTVALQQALDYARTDNVTLYVPLGCYQITDTLVITQPRNGRWQPTQIVGERPIRGKRRPAFVLPAATSGFSDKLQYKPMMTFWTNWCLTPGAKQHVYYQNEMYKGKLWCGRNRSMSPWMFNMLVQDLDFFIGLDNPSAVGIDMVGAQGCTIQDVTVYAAPDSLAGVAGGNGGGGMFGGITVYGSRYGIDARHTDGSATYTSITLVNQTCAGIIVGPKTKSTTAVIGLYVEGSPTLGGIVAAIETPPTVSSLCFAPRRIPHDTNMLHLTAENSLQSSPSSALADPVTLVDVLINTTGAAPCVRTNASLWVQNLFSVGCTEVVVSGGKSVVNAFGCKRSRACQQHIKEFALGRQDWHGIDTKYKYGFPSIVDGERSDAMVLSTDCEPAPGNLVSKHHWGRAAIDWQSVGAVNAKDFGVQGDGVSDDWPALQAVLDKYSAVVLPKGLYRLSAPLVMRLHGSSLIGVGQARTFLMPISQGFRQRHMAVLDMMADNATVKGLTIVTWSHLPTTYALNWRGNGIWRQSFTTREPESIFPIFKSVAQPTSRVPAYKRPAIIDFPLVVISGGGAFYDFDLDFGCCFGNVNPPHASIGPGTASLDEVLLQRPGFRTLLINGSRSGLRFYPHNTEQAFSDSYTEIAHSFNVTLFNAKSENNYAVVWIRDSDLIAVHGFGGNFCPFPNSTRYNDFDVRGKSYAAGYSSFMPSSFRVQRSTRITLANIVNAERVTGGKTDFISAGIGYDPRTYNMILHQDSEGFCDPLETPNLCRASPVLDRPVLWRIGGPRLKQNEVLI